MLDKVIDRRSYLLLICGYRFLLDYDFFTFCAPQERKTVYSWGVVNETPASICMSWALLFISLPFVSALLKRSVCRFSDMVMLLLYFLSYVPMTVCVRGGTLSNDCLIWMLAYAFSLVSVYWLFRDEWRILPVSIFNILNSVKDRFYALNFATSERLVFLCAVLIMATVIYISYIYTGFRLNFSLANVYDLRFEARKYPLSFLTRFLFYWSHNLLPLFWGFFLLHKRFFFAFCVVVVSFLSFGIDGAKFPLFLSALVLLLVVFYQKYKIIDFRTASIVAVIGGVGLGILNQVLNRFLVKRLIFTPIHFHEWYYQFFWGREADFFRTNLRHFGVEGPYTALGGVARAIGDFYGDFTLHANNGLFSDAISNLGIPWLIFMPIALVSVLRFFDFCTKRLEPSLVAIMSVQMALGLIGSPLVSLLLAGGLVWFPFLALLMSQEGGEGEQSSGNKNVI